MRYHTLNNERDSMTYPKNMDRPGAWANVPVCPHGDDPDLCDRGACDEGWRY